jgi:hypothetical protein
MNTVILSIKFYQMPLALTQQIENLDVSLSMVYNVEAVIKIFALRRDYFENSWNKFDFFIVVVADMSIIASITTNYTSEYLGVLRIIKLLRIVRILRVMRIFPRIRILVDSLILFMPMVANIGSLIFLILFIFGVIGVNMFAGVKFQKEINSNNNFTSFGNAMVMLMRCATGEKWNVIMRELASNS